MSSAGGYRRKNCYAILTASRRRAFLFFIRGAAMAIVTFGIDCAMVALVPWPNIILVKLLSCENFYRGAEPVSKNHT